MFHKGVVPNQEEQENLILFLRRDLFILFKSTLMYGGLMLAPIGVWLILRRVGIHFGEVSSIISTLVLFSYYLITLVLFYRSFLDYYLDIWIVTNKRIINIEQQDLFHRTIAEVRISRVQDVTSESKGFFPTFFDYGEVFVQSAGETPRITFEEVPKPQYVAKVIGDLVRTNRGNGDHV